MLVSQEGSWWASAHLESKKRSQRLQACHRLADDALELPSVLCKVFEACRVHPVTLGLSGWGPTAWHTPATAAPTQV